MANSIFFVALLVILLIISTILGIFSFRPNVSKKIQNLFWVSLILFFLVLSVSLCVFVSPLVGLAPLAPAILFAKLALEVNRREK